MIKHTRIYFSGIFIDNREGTKKGVGFLLPLDETIWSATSCSHCFLNLFLGTVSSEDLGLSFFPEASTAIFHGFSFLDRNVRNFFDRGFVNRSFLGDLSRNLDLRLRSRFGNFLNLGFRARAIQRSGTQSVQDGTQDVRVCEPLVLIFLDYQTIDEILDLELHVLAVRVVAILAQPEDCLGFLIRLQDLGDQGLVDIGDFHVGAEEHVIQTGLVLFVPPVNGLPIAGCGAEFLRNLSRVVDHIHDLALGGFLGLDGDGSVLVLDELVQLDAISHDLKPFEWVLRDGMEPFNVQYKYKQLLIVCKQLFALFLTFFSSFYNRLILLNLRNAGDKTLT